MTTRADASAVGSDPFLSNETIFVRLIEFYVSFFQCTYLRSREVRQEMAVHWILILRLI